MAKSAQPAPAFVSPVPEKHFTAQPVGELEQVFDDAPAATLEEAIAALPPPPLPQCEVAPQRECPWNSDMSAAPRDGRVILLTEALENEDGIRGMWYRALGQARPWAKAPEGWLNTQTRRWVDFTPAGWSKAQ